MTEKEALIKHMNLCFRLYSKINLDDSVLNNCSFKLLKNSVDKNTIYIHNSCYLCEYYAPKCCNCPLIDMRCDLDIFASQKSKTKLMQYILTAFVLAYEKLKLLIEKGELK